MNDHFEREFNKNIINNGRKIYTNLAAKTVLTKGTTINQVMEVGLMKYN